MSRAHSPAPRRIARQAAAAAVAMLLAGCGGGGGGAASPTPTGPTTPTTPTGPTTPTTPTTPAGTSATVQATPGLAFTPSEVGVKAGGTVTFAFGSVAHSIVFQRGTDDAGSYYGGQTSSDGAPEDVGTTADASVTRTFSRAGSFRYHCAIHPAMTGEVTVQ